MVRQEIRNAKRNWLLVEIVLGNLSKLPTRRTPAPRMDTPMEQEETAYWLIGGSVVISDVLFRDKIKARVEIGFGYCSIVFAHQWWTRTVSRHRRQVSDSRDRTAWAIQGQHLTLQQGRGALRGSRFERGMSSSQGSFAKMPVTVPYWFKPKFAQAYR